MPFDGYNFEDAILISERLVKNDTFTSVHMEEYEVEIRETKLGREEFTRDIPNVSERALRNLDERGIIRVGTHVGPGDILVGKVAPKSKSELSPEEKLLHAIFGRAGEDVKNDSLELPAGEEGVVVATKRFSRRMHLTDEQKKEITKQIREYTQSMNQRVIKVFRLMADEINEVLARRWWTPPRGRRSVRARTRTFCSNRSRASAPSGSSRPRRWSRSRASRFTRGTGLGSRKSRRR